MLRIEWMDCVIELQSKHFNIFDDIRSDALISQECQMVVTHERKLLVIGRGVVAHDGRADRVGADAVASGEEQMRLNRLDALDPRPFAATVRLDSVDQAQVGRTCTEQVRCHAWNTKAPIARRFWIDFLRYAVGRTPDSFVKRITSRLQ